MPVSGEQKGGCLLLPGVSAAVDTSPIRGSDDREKRGGREGRRRRRVQRRSTNARRCGCRRATSPDPSPPGPPPVSALPSRKPSTARSPRTGRPPPTNTNDHFQRTWRAVLAPRTTRHGTLPPHERPTVLAKTATAKDATATPAPLGGGNGPPPEVGPCASGRLSRKLVLGDRQARLTWAPGRGTGADPRCGGGGCHRGSSVAPGLGRWRRGTGPQRIGHFPGC